MNNLISIVNNFNLVIYTDNEAVGYIDTNNNPNIKIVIKPLADFYNYKYRDYWIKNQRKNYELNYISWELNMLWAEKISFVKETIEKSYFDTEFYGWCDIGYFRNKDSDMHTSLLNNWPNSDKIALLERGKIIYGCVNNNDVYMNRLFDVVKMKNEKGLPMIPIPSNQISVAGGFFLMDKSMYKWWHTTFDNTLIKYFENNYLVKDDQVIIIDCIFSNLEKFILFHEKDYYDNWFMFQRIFS